MTSKQDFVYKFESESESVCGKLRFDYTHLPSLHRIVVIDDKDVNDPLATLGSINLNGSFYVDEVHDGDDYVKEILQGLANLAHDCRKIYEADKHS